jgi:hypothetical protein
MYWSLSGWHGLNAIDLGRFSAKFCSAVKGLLLKAIFENIHFQVSDHEQSRTTK